MLDRMESEGLLPRIPVYVDSPLSVNATTIFGTHPECFDSDLSSYMLVDDNPFGFNNLTYIKDVELSKSLNDTREPCIIISSSGMMNAGRVKHHLSNNIESKRNTILIVGYCSPETPGGKLRDGVKAIRLFGEWKEVRADVIVMDSFSAHADRGELIDFLHNQRGRLRKLFLVHGTIERQEKFRDLLTENGFRDVEIPALSDEFELK
jgi:metallo-beta-lactamase family protein